MSQETLEKTLENISNTMSMPELIVARDHFQTLIDSKKEAETNKLLESFIETVEKSGLSIEAVLAKLQPSQVDSKENKVRKPARQKYRNPKDESQTWTGRGRSPHWVTDYLKSQGWVEVNKDEAGDEEVETNKEERDAILESVLIEQE